MKKILALLVISVATVTGCAKHGNPPEAQNYHCRQIIHQMHAAPHRYRSIGRNKRLATTEAMLQKEYRYYDCHDKPER